MPPMPRPPAIQLRLHAYPQLLVDGRPVPLQLKRAWALLACLGDAGRRVSRTHAAHLLWPEAEGGVGRTRLRRLVHQVNGIAGLELVSGDADTLGLATEPAPPVVDLAQTRRIAFGVLAPDDGARVDGTPLLGPSTHTLLAGFQLEADTFEAWLAARRQEHGQLMLRALQRLAQRQLALGDADTALAASRRLLEIDGFADTGHALLLESLGRLGQGASLEAAYAQCASLMREEFGMRPSAAVEAAYALAVKALQGTPPPPAAPAAPAVRYAQVGGAAIAYATLGSGPEAMVWVPEAWSHIETALEEPRMRATIDRLARRCRLVLLDRRGTGLSERVGVPHTPEAAVEDVLAVMQAAGLQRAWLLCSSTCGSAGIEIAARHPERVLGLILCGVNVRGAWAPDYPWAVDEAAMETWIRQLQAGWGGPTSLELFAPSVAGDPVVRAWWTRTLQHSTSPNGLPGLLRTVHAVDVRHRLPALRVPALVVQREHDSIVRAGAGRYLAEQLPGAELVMLDGADHLFWHGSNSDAVMAAIEAFIDRQRTPAAAAAADGDQPMRPAQC
ncbi:alpha/beta fold hydrolase [Aquincola sp. MAHUQ-54]|uniref:Alpha/beta fold hydrolase n=1 Tax=Aquincola agrisoli TaxID=3119538 RepID=A0AAW9QAU4_9BURK